MADQTFLVSYSEQGLNVQGALLEKAQHQGTNHWRAQALDERRILLTAEESSKPRAVAAEAFFFGSVAMFRDMLTSLIRSAWSGCLHVDTGHGVKRVFLKQGQLVFAGSNLIDDRLGEVIYREARISLEEHVNSAAQVTKTLKFGQVLLSSGIFSNNQLWEALLLQVKQVFRSLFMVEKLSVELFPGEQAPTELVFNKSTEALLDESYGDGCSFRSFLGRLRAESEIELLIPKEEIELHYAPGTFIGDLLALISVQSNVQALLSASKLIDSYTIAVLAMLVNRGFCRVVMDADPERQQSPELTPLKSAFDMYAYVLQTIKKAFGDEVKSFPMEDLRRFAHELNPAGVTELALDAQGRMGRECVLGAFSQCAGNPKRMTYFCKSIESLVQFLLQIAGDNLDLQTARRIRQEYRSIAT